MSEPLADDLAKIHFRRYPRGQTLAGRRFGAVVTAAHASVIEKCSTELKGRITIRAQARAYLCSGRMDASDTMIR
jgi:hypothetical protein